MLVTRPPRGFNTWNTFGEKINDSLIRETADAMAEGGLLECGYRYLVIDDCWSERQRDPVTDRIVPDRVKFPNGMKAVSDYVHSRGLLFGMYSCAGLRTCGDYPGSFDHETLDAETFAAYGCDFLKYDYCFKPIADGPLLYRRMGMALRNCGRDILFSACNWGSDDVNRWIRSAGAHMYRSTGDINDSFRSFIDIAASQLDNLGFSGPNCYNDIDMLTVGMYGKGNVGSSGCGDTEYRSQFALWCLYGAPLMLGCDVRSMSEATRRLVTNRALLAINEDAEGRPPFKATVAPWNRDRFALVKLLDGGDLAVGLFNASDSDGGVCLYLCDAGIDTRRWDLALTDVFTGEDAGRCRDYFSLDVPAHDCRVFRARLSAR